MSLVYKSLQASSTTAQTLSLYTCAVTSTIVKSVMIHNSSASTRDVIIKLQKDGSSSQIVVFQEKAIAADGAAQALSESIVMQNGDILHAECSGADVDITLMYVENTASIVGISIKELSDWSITTPTTGQVAIYNATTGLWTPGAVNIANSEIDDLSDVSAGSPTSGDVLVWNGSLWTTSQTLQNLTDIVKEPDADSVSLEKDANNKIVVDGSTGAENISATIAGTSVITMKSASLRSNVNIGVGTNPTEKLEVSEGYIKASGTGTSHGFELERTGYDTYRIEHDDGGFTIFNETDTRKELLVKDGNVGIGTSSPSSKLDVSGTVTASGPIYSSDGSNPSITAETAMVNKFGLAANRSSMYITNQNASGSMQFGIGGTHAANTKMYLSSAGRVGIGTTSPASPLHVYQDDSVTGTGAGVTIEQDGVGGDAVLQFLLTGSRRWVVGADNNDGDRFKIASTTDLSTNDHFEMDGNGVAKFNGDQLQTSSDTEVSYGNITYTQSGTVVNGGFMNPAAEDNMVHLPHVVNDLAGFQKWGTITVSGLYKTRSGSAGSYTYSNPVTASDFNNGAAFDGYSSHAGSWYSDNGADGTTVTPGVITLEWTNELRYTAYAGIVFGSTAFTATDVKIEAYRGGAWQELCDITDNSDHVVLRRIENNAGPGASTTGLRFTLGGSNNNNYFRIHTLYAANYQAGNNNLSDYGSTVYTQGVHYLERYKNNNAHGHFNPADDDTYGLGNASQSWAYAYIDDYRIARGGTTYNRFYNDGTRFGIYYDGYTTRSFNILNSNGYVGIGPATTPATQLEVDGDFRASAIQINGRAATSPSNGEYGHGSKLITQFHTSGSVTAGEVYIAGSSAWTQADANATSTSTGLIAVATDAADPAEMLVEGSVKLASNAGFSTASRGDVLYLSLTAGQLTDDISGHTTGDVVRLCGYVINAGTNEVFLSPSKDWKVL